MNTKTKILVIEDDQLIRNNVISILKNENFQTISADNGQDGLTKAMNEQPDLILCDINLPNMQGFDILENFKTSDLVNTTPFIFMTAFTDREHFRRGMELGADDYLYKPFTPEELLKSIHSRLKKFDSQLNFARNSMDIIDGTLDQKLEELEAETANLQNLVKDHEATIMEETIKVIETSKKLHKIQQLIKKESENPSISEQSAAILKRLKINLNIREPYRKNLSIFQLKFNMAYPKFISNFTKMHPNLTKNDLIIVSATLMGLETTQIATMLNITDASVRKIRYRLKKKLEIKNDSNLGDYIKSFN